MSYIEEPRPLELGGLPLMATNGIKVKMAPSHPGDYIRTEVIEEMVSGVRYFCKSRRSSNREVYVQSEDGPFSSG